MLEYLQRVVVGFLGDLIRRAIKNPLRIGALAVPHHRTDKLLHQVAAIHGVGRRCAAADPSFARHLRTSPLFPLRRAYFCAALGRFAPYFDRPCLRFSTPAASRVPRIIWYRTPGR